MKKITVSRKCSYCGAWNNLTIAGYKPGQAFKTYTRCRCGNYIRWNEADMSTKNLKINEEKT